MARLRALYIDSNDNNSEAVIKLIRGIVHTPVQAKNQEEAIELLSSDKFDYFVLNVILALDEEDEASFVNGLGLIEQIRETHPRFFEYPIIIFAASFLDNAKIVNCMEAGANTFQAFKYDVPQDKHQLSRAIRRLTNNALFRRHAKVSTLVTHAELTPKSLHRKLASRYKLVVDLKAMKVFFKGVKLRLQPRQKILLFILARNPGVPMTEQHVLEEISRYNLDLFEDSLKNLKSRIKSSLKALQQKHPDKISVGEVDSFIKTVRNEGTFLTMDQDDIFTVYEKEEYPQL